MAPSRGAGEPMPAPACVRGTPSLIVIDRAGKVRAHEFGQVDDLALGLLLGRLIAERSN